MIQEIENRRSIRKYKADKINKELIEDIIYSATLAPSAKNRQPWKMCIRDSNHAAAIRYLDLSRIYSRCTYTI